MDGARRGSKSLVVSLPESKSILNRLLVLRALCNQPLPLPNILSADDVKIMHAALSLDKNFLDVKNAGTCMRFLTAYFSFLPGTRTLSGSERMKDRPIGPLVEALRNLGAEIRYLEKDGFPPLEITGGKLHGGRVNVDANESSQFSSALALIASFLPGGLTINLQGTPVSMPYLEMTLKLLEKYGGRVERAEKKIHIAQQEIIVSDKAAEGDWSAVSYGLALVSLGKPSSVVFSNLILSGLQGDEVMKDWISEFGVVLFPAAEGMQAEKMHNTLPTHFTADFTHHPDLALTMACLCAAHRVPATLTGLSTLRIKESDRLEALYCELQKFGVQCRISGDTLSLTGFSTPSGPVAVETYSDHRMAMAFSILAAVYPSTTILNPEVVEKSYPGFWEVWGKGK